MTRKEDTSYNISSKNHQLTMTRIEDTSYNIISKNHQLTMTRKEHTYYNREKSTINNNMQRGHLPRKNW